MPRTLATHRRWVLKSLLLWAAICMLAAPLFSSTSGLDPAPSIQQLHHTSWMAKDRAPSAILSITQTTDGYLWPGSLAGLFRFDGIRFEQYQR
jgi:ligand-binding sensor domain-containing protein